MNKTRNKIASKLYDQLIKLIEATPANQKTLELACLAYENYTLAQSEIDKLGPIIGSPQGTKANPACKVQVDSFAMYIKALKELRLTPATQISDTMKFADGLDEFRG